MNLKEMNKSISAGEFSNNVQSAFGVKVDITKLDLDRTQQMLLTVNEEIKKQRLSEDRHRLEKSKSYLAKIFIKENLQKHLAELQEAKKKMVKGPDGKMVPDYAVDGKGKKDLAKKESTEVQLSEKTTKDESNDEKYKFDPRGLTALRLLVGNKNMNLARRAIELAKQNKSVPAMYIQAFIPVIDILDDIMRSGMANVQLLKNIDKRAKRQLGLESNEMEISEKLRKLYESQEDQAELLLASKDVVDRIQKAVDDLSKLRNEDLPPLLDAMRDELGSQMSEAYSNIAIPTLDQLVQQLGTGRETLSQASRIITGEEAPAEQMGAEEVPVEAPVEELPAEEEFATADVAAGADEPEGREERA